MDSFKDFAFIRPLLPNLYLQHQTSHQLNICQFRGPKKDLSYSACLHCGIILDSWKLILQQNWKVKSKNCGEKKCLDAYCLYKKTHHICSTF